MTNPDQSSALGVIDWSYSTASIDSSCPRRLYYQEAVDWGDADLESGSRVPQFRSAGALLGTVVHECIAQLIDKWRSGQNLNLQHTKSTATERIQELVMANEDRLVSGSAGKVPEQDVDSMVNSLSETAEDHLVRFFQVIWPRYKNQYYILHEQTDSFYIDEFRAWVRPDLCSRNNVGEFVVTDWKVSESDPFGDPTLQQLVYADWAHKTFEPDLDRVVVQLTNTSNGETDAFRPEEKHLEQVRNRIIADCREWNSRRSKNEFKTDPTVEKCRICPYSKKCGDSVYNAE